MSSFAVEVKRIEEIWPHPTADKLELARVEGLSYTCVVQKDIHTVGDLVVFFPVDSLLPLSLVKSLKLNFLAGPAQNRVKTVNLRGIYSEGLVIPINEIPVKITGTDVTDLLGVEKFEPPIDDIPGGELHRLPEGLSAYNIESYEKYPEVMKLVQGMQCMVTEKLEGVNLSVTVRRDGPDVFVNQHTRTIIEIEENSNLYWNVARSKNIIRIAQYLLELLAGVKQVTIIGELVGPSIKAARYYELPEDDVFVFDIKADGRFLDAWEMLHLLQTATSYLNVRSIPGEYVKNPPRPSAVPIIFTGNLSDWLQDMSITEASNGQSALVNKLREGIVIKPLEEHGTRSLGRVIVKKRSPEYLIKTGM